MDNLGGYKGFLTKPLEHSFYFGNVDEGKDFADVPEDL
jgi:hypothetical protein